MSSAAQDQFTRLSQFTTIVIDSGELESIKKFVPQDATTNPSLLLAACSDPKYEPFIQDVSHTMHNTKGGDHSGAKEPALCTRLHRAHMTARVRRSIG